MRHQADFQDDPSADYLQRAARNSAAAATAATYITEAVPTQGILPSSSATLSTSTAVIIHSDDGVAIKLALSAMLGEQEKELPPLVYHTAAVGSIEEQDLGCECETISAFKFTHDFTKRGQKHMRRMQVIGYTAALTLVHDL